MVIVCAVGSFCGTIAQDYETDFRNVQQQFQERLNTTSNSLKKYVQEYPYTPYIDEVQLMEGVLHVEKKKYKQAIEVFEKTEAKNLSRSTEPMLYFYWGYALLEMEEYEKALPLFLHLEKKRIQI